MATFPNLPNGERDDRVRLVLGENDVHIFKRYEVQKRYLQVPSVFSFVVGSGDTASDLMERFPPNTAFKVLVGPELIQFSGKTDGYAPDNAQGATELMIRGRDHMALLVDGHIAADKSFTSETFFDLCNAAIRGCGLDDTLLETSRYGTRSAVTGAPIVEDVQVPDLSKGKKSTTTKDSSNTDAEIANLLATLDGRTLPFPNLVSSTTTTTESGAAQATKTVKKITGYHTSTPIKAKAGETWFSFIKKNLDRGGLFLHAGVDPEDKYKVLILSEPMAKQAPVAMLIRQRGSPTNQNAVNILAHKHKHEIQGRHLTYIVQGRASNGSSGRHRIEGRFVDDEMLALGFFDPQKTFVHQNDEAKSQEHAEYLARRACAESRRQNWTLVYTVKGHTAPLLSDPTQRTVWDIDTVIRVHDEELKIFGDFWVEGVAFRCGAEGTSTELTLMRPEDLLFGEGEFYAGPKGSPKHGFKKKKK